MAKGRFPINLKERKRLARRIATLVWGKHPAPARVGKARRVLEKLLSNQLDRYKDESPLIDESLLVTDTVNEIGIDVDPMHIFEASDL